MNNIDANKYRINVKAIKLMLDKKKPEERFSHIGKVALASGVPIIIVCYYVGELYGFTDELNQKIDRLKKFYTVDNVLGV